jgi:hypothetical protein
MNPNNRAQTQVASLLVKNRPRHRAIFYDEVDADIEHGIQLAVPQKIRADSNIVSHIAIGTGLASHDLDVLGMPPWPPGEAFRRFDHPLRIDAELLVLEPIDCVFSRAHRFS